MHKNLVPDVPRSGTSWESQSNFRDGTRGSILRNFRFIDKAGLQDEVGRYMIKHSSDPRIAYPELNFQIRDIVRVVSIVALFAPPGPVYGNIHLIEPYGENGHRRHVSGAPSSCTSRESQANFRDGTPQSTRHTTTGPIPGAR